MKALRRLFFYLLFKFRIGHLLLLRNRSKQKVPVLVFHKIIPEFDKIWPGVHPRLFEEIILLLKKNYTIYPLEFLYSKPGMDFSRACFISFDDGYNDYLEYAYPILKRHQVHSTLFVLPNDLSNKGHIWTSTIIYFVKHYWFSEIRDFFMSQGQYIDFGNKFEDFSVNLAITKHLCGLKQSERAKVMDALQKKFDADHRIIPKELLSYEELATLDPTLVTIASHSLTHPSFSLETDLEFIEHELRDSKLSIEKELKLQVSSFAFPFTKYNSLSMQLVKKYYRMSFTRINDLLDLKKLKNDPAYYYDLPRYNIHQDSAEEVFLLINGFHDKFKI